MHLIPVLMIEVSIILFWL